VGDGSLQLTVQELSPMVRLGLKPIIFVINNRGYTVERLIYGKHKKFNDVHNWNWTQLLSTFGDLDGSLSKSYTVKTKQDVNDLLDNPTFAKADKIQLVEVCLDPLDAPRALVVQAEMTAKGNAYSA